MRRLTALVAGVLAVCALATPAVASAKLTAPAKARRGPIAAQADIGGSVASFLLKSLGNYVAKRNAGNGFGQMLMQLGLGDASAAGLEAIESTLKRVDSQLSELNEKVNDLNRKVDNLVCRRAQDTAALVRSQTKAAWEDIAPTVAKAKRAVRDRPEQKRLGEELVAKIKEEFKTTSPRGAVIHINDSLVGTGGSSSMIDDCGFAYQEANGNFVTPTIRERVTSLVDYWQLIEAQAAVMQIGLLVDRGEQSSAQAARERAEANLTDESAKVKPLPTDPNEMVADLRTHLLWWARILSSRADRAADLAAQIPPRGRWKIPSKSELGELAKSCCDGSTNVASWFRDNTLFSFDNWGLWTQLLSATRTSSKQFEALDLAAPSVTYSSVNPDANVYVLLVNGKSAALWSKYAYSADP